MILPGFIGAVSTDEDPLSRIRNELGKLQEHARKLQEDKMWMAGEAYVSRVRRDSLVQFNALLCSAFDHPPLVYIDAASRVDVRDMANALNTIVQDVPNVL